MTEPASPRWVGRALACGGVAVAAMWLAGWMIGQALLPLRSIGQSGQCQGNVFQITRAFHLYVDDNDDRYPPAARWMDRTYFYVDQERRLHCPTVSRPGESRFGYAMNRQLSGRERSRVEDPDGTAVVYDSTSLGRSASDDEASLPHPGRHVTRSQRGAPFRRGNYVGYAAGNARIRLDSAPSPAR